ncbi:MAG TPA: hypothetical protein VGH27_21690 [Streptosporangiaceae bacterium]
MRHQLLKITAAAVGVTTVLALSTSSGAAAQAGDHLITVPHALVLESDHAASDGCLTIISQGPRATAPATFNGAAPAATKYTVTVTGTTIAGQPAHGQSDGVFLTNADDPDTFAQEDGFTGGVATFHVPAGHYWAVGDFTRLLPKEQSWDEYLDVLPQFSVAGNATVHLAAAAATSEVRALTPQRAIEQYATFQLVRTAAAGPGVSLGWALSNGGPKEPAPSLYVSPTSASPTVGTLATVTNLQLGSAALPSESRYLYNLAYQSAGTITSQQHVVNQAALATVRPRYFSATKSAGLSAMTPAFPVDNKVCSLGAAFFDDMQFPAQQPVYLSASPALSWQRDFIQNEARDFSGGQVGPLQVLVPGEQQTQDFGAYPLHPAPNVRLSDIAGAPPVQVSAGRAGNTLRLAMTAFSDSIPGHLGQGTFAPVKTAASYEIDQNGTKIAAGAVPHFYGPFSAAATLSPASSLIRFSLDTAESARLNPLSTATQTVWTWRSAHESAATLPAGWTCLPGGAVDRACQVQPMMTLRYHVVGLALDGATSPGQQVVQLQVGHLQLAMAAKIASAAISVSFNGGKTWHAARITGHGESYAAVFTASAGAQVTLRTSAADASGGSVTETITNAYQIAP